MNASSNYTRITCLPRMWKFLTSKHGEIYCSIISCEVFLEEEKGFRKETKGTAKLQSIDQHNLKESKTGRKMYKISEEVIKFIKNTMESWRVELTAGRKSLAESKIQRGIFQGDTLSPLLFVFVMIQLNHVLRKYIG